MASRRAARSRKNKNPKKKVTKRGSQARRRPKKARSEPSSPAPVKETAPTDRRNVAIPVALHSRLHLLRSILAVERDTPVKLQDVVVELLTTGLVRMAEEHGVPLTGVLGQKSGKK